MTEPENEREHEREREPLPNDGTGGDGGDGGVDIDIEALVDRMDPDPRIRRAIRAHLFRQLGVEKGFVRLANGKIVREGGDAEGEGDE